MASRDPYPARNSGFGNWLKTHTYRIFTALLTLAFFGFAFLYHPEWISWWLRLITHGIEQATALLPYPYGDQVEVALKGFGGSFWLQITVAIVALRTFLSSLAFAWRRQRRTKRTEQNDPVDRFDSNRRTIREIVNRTEPRL